MWIHLVDSIRSEQTVTVSNQSVADTELQPQVLLWQFLVCMGAYVIDVIFKL